MLTVLTLIPTATMTETLIVLMDTASVDTESDTDIGTANGDKTLIVTLIQTLIVMLIVF